ncbi:MAG: hypothetical protein ABJB66_10795 [Gemmatimonadaceae bacterium]
MSDEKLKSAYNAYVSASAPADCSACPSPEKLEALAAGNDAAGDSTSMALFDHVFSCAYCREDFALLRSVQSATNSTANRRSKLHTFTGVAAAAVLLLAIGFGTNKLLRSPDVIVRGAPDGASDVILISPVATVNFADVGKFSWQGVAGASSYELEVLDTNGVVVLTRVTANTSLPLPTDDAARVASLPSFDWFVTARRADGNERRSAITRVRLSAKPNR